MAQRDLALLAERLERLLDDYMALQESHRALQAKQATWEAERARLNEQNRLLQLKFERLRAELGQ